MTSPMICKGCGTADGVDATVALCTECIKWGADIIKDVEARGSRPIMDTTFIDAAFREFEPVEKAAKEKEEGK